MEIGIFSSINGLFDVVIYIWKNRKYLKKILFFWLILIMENRSFWLAFYNKFNIISILLLIVKEVNLLRVDIQSINMDRLLVSELHVDSQYYLESGFREYFASM